MVHGGPDVLRLRLAHGRLEQGRGTVVELDAPGARLRDRPYPPARIVGGAQTGGGQLRGKEGIGMQVGTVDVPGREPPGLLHRPRQAAAMGSHRPHGRQAVGEPQLVDVVHAEVDDLVGAGVGVTVDETGQDVHARRVDLAVAGGGPGGLDQVRSRDRGDAVPFDDDIHRAARGRARAGDVVHAPYDQPGIGSLAPVRRVALGRIDRFVLQEEVRVDRLVAGFRARLGRGHARLDLGPGFLEARLGLRHRGIGEANGGGQRYRDGGNSLHGSSSWLRWRRFAAAVTAPALPGVPRRTAAAA